MEKNSSWTGGLIELPQRIEDFLRITSEYARFKSNLFTPNVKKFGVGTI